MAHDYKTALTMPNPAASPTPGPWHINEHGSDAYVWGPTELRLAGCIARVNLGETHNVTRAQREANAKLIAAAPDMLQALRTVLARCRMSKDDAESSDILRNEIPPLLRAAIAKATGE